MKKKIKTTFSKPTATTKKETILKRTTATTTIRHCQKHCKLYQ